MIEHKTFDSVEIKAVGDDGTFESVIATLNTRDKDDDIIVPGAFGNATISVVPAHDHSSVPLGKAKMEDRGNLAVAKGRFNLDIPAAKDWHSALKFDLENLPAVQEWSFAFRPVDAEMDTIDGERVRILKKMDVMEISPVLRGAGVGTGTLSVKRRNPAYRPSARLVSRLRWQCYTKHGDFWPLQDVAAFLELRGGSVSVDDLQQALGALHTVKGKVGYRVKPPGRLTEFARKAAHDLGIPEDLLAVHYIEPCSLDSADLKVDERIVGFCQPDDDGISIFIRDDLNAEDELVTLAHEAYHASEWLRGNLSDHDEDAADAYGERFARWIVHGVRASSFTEEPCRS